jgi:histidinol phosphatase-like PHP family hydrolase
VKLATHKKRKSETIAVELEDLNMRAAALLYDMAAMQPTERSQFGYKRAAKAIVGLPMSVADVVAAGTLREIPFVGPSSARVITEFIETGSSATVDAALATSSKASLVAERRSQRTNFLSHFVLQSTLSASGSASRELTGRGNYRGDFQMHSTWSDGGESLAVMAKACLALGHTCLGITDHSYGLPIARGMSMSSVAKQHLEIDKLNEEFDGTFRIFKGIEANILTDGSLDLQPDERGSFEFIVASPHSQLRRPDDQTARMLGAVRGAGVAMLGHPRGRMFDKRAGIIADWDRVFAEAAKRNVAIELDGNWHRQDLDFALARRALDAGCIFALDSDAHSIGELRFSEYAIAHARLALIPAERVINCWTNERLGEWMESLRIAD